MPGMTGQFDLKRAVAADYDRTASGYARSVAGIYRILARPLVDAAAVRLGEQVLDLGAGTGAVGATLPPGTAVTAVDISVGQLLHNPFPRRVAADAEALPFAEGSFHVVVAGLSIAHMPEPLRVLAEARRVLTREGRISLSTWARPQPAYRPKEIVLQALERVAGAPGTRARQAVEALHDAVGSPGALGSALSGAGFRDVRVVVASPSIPWPGSEAFLDYRLSIFGSCSLLDGHKPERFREEVLRDLEAVPPAERDWAPTILVASAARSAP